MYWFAFINKHDIMLKTECLSQYFFHNYRSKCHQYHLWVFKTTTVNILVICVLIQRNYDLFFIDFLLYLVQVLVMWFLVFLSHLTHLKKVSTLFNLNLNIKV